MTVEEIVALARKAASHYKGLPKGGRGEGRKGRGSDPSLAALLVRARYEAGLTQKEYCEATGLPFGTLALWDRGQSTKRVEWPELVAEVTRLAAVLDGDAEKHPAAVVLLASFGSPLAVRRREAREAPPVAPTDQTEGVEVLSVDARGLVCRVPHSTPLALALHAQAHRVKGGAS